LHRKVDQRTVRDIMSRTAAQGGTGKMSSVLITGANRGLGLEFVRQYAQEGWTVYAATRDPGSAGKLQQVAKAHPDLVKVLPLDVTDAQSVKRAAAEIADVSIDVLINNAGIFGGSKQRVGNMDYDAWAEILNVNTMGPMRVIEAFIEHVARSERKVIVNMTSGLGSMADNTTGGYIAYRTSKAALNMLAKSAAVELAPRGITSVVMNPGWVQTDMGGPSATMTVEASISALRRIIAKLDIQQSGKFFHHNGSEYAW
jgi:NAD(P)-dependent dehydrogenase (short-subunit alcohol dehydrogenase family)